MKKIAIVCMLVTFSIIAVSFASAAFTQTKPIEKNVSPLYLMRAEKAISLKGKIVEIIKTRFLANRISFFAPSDNQKTSLSDMLIQKSTCLQRPSCGNTYCSVGGCERQDSNNLRDNLNYKTQINQYTCNPFTVCYCATNQPPSCDTSCFGTVCATLCLCN